MLYRAVAGEFEDIDVAGDIRAHVSAGIVERVSHARLRREVDDSIEIGARKRSGKGIVIAYIDAMNRKVAADPFQLGDARFLQRDRVISVEIIDADDRFAAFEKARGRVHTYKAGDSGDEDGHRYAPAPMDAS